MTDAVDAARSLLRVVAELEAKAAPQFTYHGSEEHDRDYWKRQAEAYLEHIRELEWVIEQMRRELARLKKKKP
jgi:hypothetical protein